MTERVREEFSNLEDGPTEYVITEVVDRIFDSIGKPYLRLSVKDFVDCANLEITQIEIYLSI